MPRGKNVLNKLNLLKAYLTAVVYELICEETTYDDVLTILENLFVKPKNEITLVVNSQQPSKTLRNN